MQKRKAATTERFKLLLNRFYTTTFVIAAAAGMMTAYDRTRPRHLSLDRNVGL